MTRGPSSSYGRRRRELCHRFGGMMALQDVSRDLIEACAIIWRHGRHNWCLLVICDYGLDSIMIIKVSFHPVGIG